jgi:cytochrome bd-I ubiquinol oxidase subunit X
MWYFSWILGVGLALTFGVLNAIWYEVMEQRHFEQANGMLKTRET